MYIINILYIDQNIEYIFMEDIEYGPICFDYNCHGQI